MEDELLLDAIRLALDGPGEHRLFRSGKLAGLFPNRNGTSLSAARRALTDGLLEVARTEVRGRVTIEWVKATPKAVDHFDRRCSPRHLLAQLRDALAATVAEADCIGQLADRIGRAIRRLELNTRTAAGPIREVVPWAAAAIDYLDRRPGRCPLPELFLALQPDRPELTLPEFLNGLTRLADARLLTLHAGDPTEPEFATVFDGQLKCEASR